MGSIPGSVNMASAPRAAAKRLSTSGLLREMDTSVRVAAVLQLNTPLQPELLPLWTKAAKRFCADGGANRLFHSSFSFSANRERLVPDCIAGDLDSAERDVLSFYRKRGTQVHDLGADQDTTDLHKCIQLALDDTVFFNGDSSGWVIGVGALGGRLDHLLGALSNLHAFIRSPVLLLGQQSLACALPAGTTDIIPDTLMEGPACGLIPLAGRANVSTSGLKWNLDNDGLEFGGLVSTSNEVVADCIQVDTDAPLVWTSELRGRSGE